MNSNIDLLLINVGAGLDSAPLKRETLQIFRLVIGWSPGLFLILMVMLAQTILVGKVAIYV